MRQQKSNITEIEIYRHMPLDIVHHNMSDVLATTNKIIKLTNSVFHNRHDASV